VQAHTAHIRVSTEDGLEIKLAASAAASTCSDIHPLALAAAKNAAKSKYPTMEAANKAFNRSLTAGILKARASRTTSINARSRAMAATPAAKAAMREQLARADERDEQAGLPTYHPAGPVNSSHTLFFAHDQNNHASIEISPAWVQRQAFEAARRD
jgi:hypothetical protein